MLVALFWVFWLYDKLLAFSGLVKSVCMLPPQQDRISEIGFSRATGLPRLRVASSKNNRLLG